MISPLWFFAYHAFAPVRVACIGDSMTLGKEAPRGYSYPSQLRTMLGPGYDVRTFARSNATMLSVGASGLETQAETGVAFAFEPQIVVIMIGTNDANPSTWEMSRGRFVRDYKRFIETWRTTPIHPKVFVCSLPPIHGPQNGERSRLVETEINPCIRQIARETGAGLIDMNEILQDAESFGADGLLPKARGFGAIAESVFESIVDSRLIKAKWTVMAATSEEPEEGPARFAIDGDPDTYWHSRYSPTPSPGPHQLVIDTHTLGWYSGFRYLARQDGGTNGNAKAWRFEVSEDGRTWTPPCPPGIFGRQASQRVRFLRPVRLRYFRFTIVSEQNGGPFASAAEVDVIPAPPLSYAPPVAN